MTAAAIAEELLSLADPAYRQFQLKLIPSVDPSRVLGVRTPALRRYARDLARSHENEARKFMEQLPHTLYEEDNLHGELIGILAKTPNEAFTMLDEFLPHIDNWATCDLIRVPAFAHDLPLVLEKIRSWTASDPEYAVRFGVVQLMMLFLDDAFDPEHLKLVTRINRPEYYVNMARAWYYSFALIKQPAATLPLFETRPIVLDVWTHNKSLQKACESRRIDKKQKDYLKSLKTRG